MAYRSQFVTIELIKVKYNLIIGKYINQSHQTNMQTQEIIHLL